MNSVAFETLRRLVRDDVLAHPERYEWTLQGFGMLRMYLPADTGLVGIPAHIYALRLHIWDSRYRVANVSDIHDHPWDFESLVLRGSIRNVCYKLHEVDSVEDATHLTGKITCGPSPVRKGVSDVLPVRLVVVSEEVYGAGDTYKMGSEELHASFPIDGTVTMCRRSFVNADTETARVVWLKNTAGHGAESHAEGWVSAEPRRATDEEVKSITRGARMRGW